MSNQEMVATVYRNVLNREPKEGGLNFWSSIWDDKSAAYTMINHLLNWQFSDPINPNESDQLTLLDQALIKYKRLIGNYLAVERKNNDLEIAHAAFAYPEEGNSW